MLMVVYTTLLRLRLPSLLLLYLPSLPLLLSADRPMALLRLLLQVVLLLMFTYGAMVTLLLLLPMLPRALTALGCRMPINVLTLSVLLFPIKLLRQLPYLLLRLYHVMVAAMVPL